MLRSVNAGGLIVVARQSRSSQEFRARYPQALSFGVDILLALSDRRELPMFRWLFGSQSEYTLLPYLL